MTPRHIGIQPRYRISFHLILLNSIVYKKFYPRLNYYKSRVRVSNPPERAIT